MKQWLFLLTVALAAAANNWSFLESSDPNVRMEQLLNDSSYCGQIPLSEVQRALKDYQGTHLTPIRVHGGIGP